MISIKSLPDDVDDRRRQTKKMAPTSTKSILVVGGAGALGRGVVSGFSKLAWNVTNVDFERNDIATQNVNLDRTQHWTDRICIATSQLASQQFDSIIHTGGGWAGGRFGQDETLKSMEMMWEMNIQSAILGALSSRP